MVTRLAHCVMVQGTSSHVGKSVIATALCRVLREEGYAVAPFKAQNMSLNAAATPGGAEIGRAQAVQAEAAGVAPRASMNPILLKPEADSRSQLVVLGRHRRTVEAREYWRTRGSLWPVVRKALGDLRREFEVVVIEGAGSPAEVNLARGDLANMRVARACGARVLLVGDIERGGVFAQLLGTLDLLAPSDRPRVRGLLVNKFRGDPALFSGGVRYLARASGVPVLGVLPYAADLGVAPEDALSLEAPRSAGGRPNRRMGSAGRGPDIAVLRLPHLSNFDEFVPLASAGAAVRYVADPGALAVPDLVIVPGSKTTIADLAWLRATGLAARLRALADAGVPILGICGGYQMLGLSLADPDGVEGPARRVRGLGLLPLRTTFRRAKTTVPVRGTIVSAFAGAALKALPFDGYEIHLGDTTRGGCGPFALLARATGGARIRDGAVSADGLVAGTYVHGLFESAEVRAALLRGLARRSGRAFEPVALPADPYAALSSWFREAVDFRKLCAALELPAR